MERAYRRSGLDCRSVPAQYDEILQGRDSVHDRDDVKVPAPIIHDVVPRVHRGAVIFGVFYQAVEGRVAPEIEETGFLQLLVETRRKAVVGELRWALDRQEDERARARNAAQLRQPRPLVV